MEQGRKGRLDIRFGSKPAVMVFYADVSLTELGDIAGKSTPS
jgi:hypothetical protein